MRLAIDWRDRTEHRFSHSHTRWGTSQELWEPQIDVFAQHFRVLTYDIRGHGGTPAAPSRYTVEQLGNDFLELLDSLSITRVHYCGVSLGGAIGQWLGVSVPHRIDRLVLANTAARFGTPEVWNGRIEAVTHGGLVAIADASMERWFSDAFRVRAPKRVSWARALLLATPVDGYVASCSALRDMDYRELARGIKSPTLVVGGSWDQVTTPEDVAWLATHMPRARSLMLPAAHLANVEAADQFNRAVIAFLSSPEA